MILSVQHHLGVLRFSSQPLKTTHLVGKAIQHVCQKSQVSQLSYYNFFLCVICCCLAICQTENDSEMELRQSKAIKLVE